MRYDSSMAKLMLDEMKRLVGFGTDEAKQVRALRPHVSPHLPRIVDRFYEELLRHPTAATVLGGNETQLAALRRALHHWLEDLFTSRYGEAYYRTRVRIGETHVRVGLPQHLMLLGMELVWQELLSILKEAGVADLDRKLSSLHKLLTIELVIMLESYKDSYSLQIRRTERSAAEEKLTRTAHLAEIGQLAASLAHEIKNPLAGISAAIQILRDDMAGDDPHQPVVKEIFGQIRRLDETVKDLLQFARPTPPNLKEVSLYNAVNRVLSVVGKQPEYHRIRMELDGDAEDSSVQADEVQIEQLLMNIILNAAHASGEEGVVRIGIHPNASTVRLTVSDNGQGMSAEVRDRAFEPFYTTKAKGTGLGLSICRRIMEVHRGRIELQSDPGKGSTVVVEFPRDPGRSTKEVR